MNTQPVSSGSEAHNPNGTLTPAYASKLLNSLCVSRWYGTLSLKLEAGRIVLIRKEETIKSVNPRELNRGENNVSNK